jgi:hypothetical protein
MREFFSFGRNFFCFHRTDEQSSSRTTGDFERVKLSGREALDATSIRRRNRLYVCACLALDERSEQKVWAREIKIKVGQSLLRNGVNWEICNILISRSSPRKALGARVLRSGKALRKMLLKGRQKGLKLERKIFY